MNRDDLISEARRVTVAEFCASRGIRIKHGDQGQPCPGCGGRDRFSVSLPKNLWQCRVAGLGGDAIALAQHIDGTDFLAACEAVIGRAQPVRDDRPRPAQRPQPVAPDDDKRREWVQGKAREIFFDARDPRRTIVERYLADERGLPGVIDDTLAQTLRFHPACPFRDDAGKLYTAPAMIAAFRPVGATLDLIVARMKDGASFEGAECETLADPALVVGIHRTRLTPDGKKVSRAMLGPVKGAGVFLSPPTGAMGEFTLTVSEGIESALSAMRRGFHGCIALGSTSGITAFEPVRLLEHLTIAAENNEASRKAVAACVERWTAAGKTVRVIRPIRGDDFNDLDRRGAA